MNKQDLAGVLAYRTGISQEKVGMLIDLLTDNIKYALARGETVYLRGFGSFGVKVRAARRGRIIATGAGVDIPSRRVAVFRPYPGLEAMVALPDKDPGKAAVPPQEVTG